MRVSEHTAGDGSVIRAKPAMLREDPRDCPAGVALSGRPLVKQVPARSRRKPVLDFPLGPLQSVLDAVEFGDGLSVDEALRQPGHWRRCLPVHREWTTQAVHAYVRTWAKRAEERAAAGLAPLVPESDEWVVIATLRGPDRRGAQRYERTAWGRRYTTADGAERELWLLSVNTVKTDRSAAEIAAAASVVAQGVRARSAFGSAYETTTDETVMPDRVRVVGYGCGDAGVRVLADCSAEHAVSTFAATAKGVFTRVLDAERLVPGASCASCEGLAGCEAPHRSPGVLGVPVLTPRSVRARRSVSVSDLRAHRECPARHHATRVLHLKGPQPENEAIRRGRAVDAWLNVQHGAQSRTACTAVPLPDLLPGLTETESPAAVRMLESHRARCPLRGMAADERIRVQPRISVYDPFVDAVVIADADLLYTDRGAWVWRETKTASSRPWEGRGFLESYPQLALAVALMNAGVLGPVAPGSRVELELLYEQSSTVEELDPADPRTVAEAREVIAAMAGPWAVDETYPSRPGRWCRSCEALPWCDPGRRFAATPPDAGRA
jgi:hypothetical protein